MSAVLSSLKTVFEVIKDWPKRGENVTVNKDTIFDLTSAVLGAREHALAARQAQDDLMRRNVKLEEDLRALKDWRAEKDSYEIINVGARGAFVYAPKPGKMPGVTSHWLCQPCFDASRKSLLQFMNTIADHSLRQTIALWKCPVCDVNVRALPNAGPG